MIQGPGKPEDVNATTPIHLAEVLKETFQEIVEATRYSGYETMVSNGEKSFSENVRSLEQIIESITQEIERLKSETLQKSYSEKLEGWKAQIDEKISSLFEQLKSLESNFNLLIDKKVSEGVKSLETKYAEIRPLKEEIESLKSRIEEFNDSLKLSEKTLKKYVDEALETLRIKINNFDQRFDTLAKKVPQDFTPILEELKAKLKDEVLEKLQTLLTEKMKAEQSRISKELRERLEKILRYIESLSKEMRGKPIIL